VFHLAFIALPQAWHLFAGVISGQLTIESVTRHRLVRIALTVLSA
jgi:hypothetical protein